MFEFAASMFIIAIGVVVAVTIIATKPKTMTDEQRYGPLVPERVCGRCGATGAVRQRIARQKDGISTPKMIAGALTGGLALLAVGVHRYRETIQRHCGRCGETWRE